MGIKRRKFFTVSTNWFCPSTVRFGRALVIGGGGGGYYNGSTYSGGNSGQVIDLTNVDFLPGFVMPVIIGSGGVGGTTPANGGDTSFAGLVAQGGKAPTQAGYATPVFGSGMGAGSNVYWPTWSNITPGYGIGGFNQFPTASIQFPETLAKGNIGQNPVPNTGNGGTQSFPGSSGLVLIEYEE